MKAFTRTFLGLTLISTVFSGSSLAQNPQFSQLQQDYSTVSNSNSNSPSGKRVLQVFNGLSSSLQLNHYSDLTMNSGQASNIEIHKYSTLSGQSNNNSFELDSIPRSVAHSFVYQDNQEVNVLWAPAIDLAHSKGAVMQFVNLTGQEVILGLQHEGKDIQNMQSLRAYSYAGATLDKQLGKVNIHFFGPQQQAIAQASLVNMSQQSHIVVLYDNSRVAIVPAFDNSNANNFTAKLP